MTDRTVSAAVTTLQTTLQTTLMEPTSPFSLWSIALITLSVLVVTSMVFVMTVLLCRLLKERRNKSHTYNTRSRQGSIRLQGSVSLIKNQESLEVTNAHYHRQATTAIIPDDNSVSSVESDAVNQEQQAQAVPNEGSGEPDLRSNNESLHEVTEGGGAHMYDTPYENSGAMSQKHQGSSDQLTSREYTHHSHSVDETFQNNQLESVSTVTRESQQQRRETTAHVVDKNAAAVTVTLTFEDGSDLHNIPGFQDPELKGEDGDDGRLMVNAPPDIYSSQILSTVVNDEEEGGYGHRVKGEEHGTETAASMGMGNGSEIPSSHGIDIIFNTDSPLIHQDFDASLPEGDESASFCQSRESQVEVGKHRMTPEGAQEGIIQECVGGLIPSITLRQHDHQTANEDDVVYDQPVIKQGKNSPAGGHGVKDGGYDDIKVPGIVDLTALFDDPGYTKGLNLDGNAGDSKNSESQLPIQRKLSTQKRTSNLKSNSAPKMQTLSVQMSRAPGMKSSIDSLALLDYGDSELNELDPMIASCLRSPNLSDTDDEIVISEV